MNSVEDHYFQRLIYIPNYTDVPDCYTEKPAQQPLQVVYVGRGTAEKRAYLVSSLAKACISLNMNVAFTIVGDIEQEAALKHHSCILFSGEVTDTEQLKNIYTKADVVLITSEREGFPMALMEGMAYGAIPVSTPVGDIPKHIHTAQTGFLTSTAEAHTVVKEMTAFLALLIEDANKRSTISRNAYAYAKSHFSKEKFRERYRALLLGR